MTENRTFGLTIERVCRSCRSSELVDVLAFGETPLADRLVDPKAASEPEPRAPLTFAHCMECGLAQIRETVAPEVLFGGAYAYYSSVSPALLRHFTESAEALIARRSLSRDSLVVEAASNDGYMLQTFHRHGIRTLGIDPAPGPAGASSEKGIPTLNTFFTRALAVDLAADGVRADVLLANNVLAHVEDLNGFVEAIAIVLKEDGVAVLECPYLLDLLDNTEFDTIYHQHLCYFSLTALVELLARAGLVIVDVERLRVHGGSLRLSVAHTGRASSAVASMLRDEDNRRTGSPAVYDAFLRGVDRIRSETRRLMDADLAAGRRIAGYGAAAKATTLLHSLGISREHLPYIVDRNPKKHGFLMPGTHIEIRHPDALLADNPDCVLILAWNFANEIMRDQASYSERGGRFLVPIPVPMVTTAQSMRLAL